MIGRREVVTAGLVGAGALLAVPAGACSITARRISPFSETECQRALRRFVSLLNEGPGLTLEAIAQRAHEMSVTLDDEMLWGASGDGADTHTDRANRFYKEFRLSDGKLDPRPIRLAETNLIRRLRNRATHQFTLERYSFHEADPEGCNGLFTHDEFFGVDRSSYLATFENNRLTRVKPFPEWYLEAKG